MHIYLLDNGPLINPEGGKAFIYFRTILVGADTFSLVLLDFIYKFLSDPRGWTITFLGGGGLEGHGKSLWPFLYARFMGNLSHF